ncbi:MAG: hypothetical protein P8Y60_06755, partial [Calditrichota bacterium]
AGEIQSLAPWEWMEEQNIFGVDDPEGNYLGFVSIMGQIGQHFAIAVYLGPQGLYDFWEIQYADPTNTPDRILEVPQLQLSFESREQLAKEDLQIIRQLGYKYRGAHHWPLFRSYRPGYFPWYLESDEARFLEIALQQSLDIAVRFREDPSLLEPRGDTTYLVRTPQPDTPEIQWEDRRSVIVPPEPTTIEYSIDMGEVETVNTLPRSRHPLEIDFFLTPSIIQEEGTRPLLPYLFLLVDSGSETVVGAELFTANPTLKDMYRLLPGNFIRQMLNQGYCPNQVQVRSALLVDLLEPLTEQLDIEVVVMDRLPSLDKVKSFLINKFR